MADPDRPGQETTEYRAARSGSAWGVMAIIIGVIGGVAAAVIEAGGGENSTVGIIAGAVVAIAGIVLKTLSTLGYISSRTQVKVESLRKDKP